MAQTLFSIGYEKARLADVVATLSGAGIATLIDVRDRPISRRPGFSKHQLAAAVEAAGIRYLSLRALGTPPEGREANRRREWERSKSICQLRFPWPLSRWIAVARYATRCRRAHTSPGTALCRVRRQVQRTQYH